MHKYLFAVFFSFLLFSVSPTKADLFCEGFEEGYIEGFEQDSKTIKVKNFPPCPIISRNSRRDDFTKFRIGYQQGVACGKLHRSGKVKQKCKKHY